jgi:hypothetical protein
MTNTQLWLAIGIPSTLVILSWLSNNRRLDRVEDKVDALREQMYREFTEFYKTLGKHDAQIEALKEGKH